MPPFNSREGPCPARGVSSLKQAKGPAGKAAGRLSENGKERRGQGGALLWGLAKGRRPAGASDSKQDIKVKATEAL